MGKTKIIQYTHRPNSTELGLGNTHETYMLINTDTNLSNIFPIGTDVVVEDTSNQKKYFLKAANSREFRVNQMGEIYRDHNVLPGDEIVITNISNENASATYITVNQFNRVVFSVGGNGAEIINKERLDDFSVEDMKYEINVYDRGQYNKLNIAFKEAKKKRVDSPNTTDFYTISINDSKLANGTYYLTIGEKSSIATLAKSSYNEIEFEDGLVNKVKTTTQDNPEQTNLSATILSYLTAIRTKPFLLLAGISGTGKSRIVRKLAQATDNIDTFANDDDRWKLHSPQNFQLIQVKPNWHNSMDLVGFKSNIGGEHYEMTPFIEFVAKAWQHQDTPFFLCLDEMNLAPVEEYFAEFLSAIESRSNEGGSYETDPIIKPFRDFGEKVAKEMIDKLLGEELESLKAEDIVKLSLTAQRFLTMGLTLPKNLIVMGTVNMDETTFSFSRKVLDRAMSIEMNEVMYDDFLSGKTENDIEVLVERNSDLVNRPISGLKVKDEDSQTVINFLSSINALLDNTPYKLGYRAANEALLYVSAAKTFGCDDWKKAMDDFTLMKILSRIEGDDSKLKTQDGKDLLSEFKYLLSSTYGFSEESKTLKKLNQMINILDRDKFVSFWG